MVIVEKSFPRGGTTAKPTTTSTEANEKIIFGALQKKLKKPKTKSTNDLQNFGAEKSDNIETISAELLNYDTIQDGMNIMVMVKAIDQLHISVSLPGRMTARVSVLEISEAYTKATQSFLQSSAQSENYKPLKDLFRVGQVLYGRVQEVKQNAHGRTNINMSLKPAQVHADLSHTNIRKGFIFSGAVEEVQEHGCIIETGIKGMRAFLPLAKSVTTHGVGELIYLKVDKITPDKTASTCICKEVKPESLKIKNQIEPNIDYILPTTTVQFKVTKRLKDGLQGSLMNDAFTGYINEHQLADPLALPEDYEISATLNARILYVMPLTKLVYLTLNPHNARAPKVETDGGDDNKETATSEVAVQAFQRGDVIEKAKVHRLGTGGVILVLKNKFKGIISFKAIKANYMGNYDQDELLTKYAKRTEHTVRVLGYDLMDSMYICTDDAGIVNEKVLDLKDLQPGEFQNAVVKQRDAKLGGYVLQVGKIKGVIEQLFLAPTSKPLEDKAKLRCRVVAVNPERNVVYMTNRAEYMSKQCKVLTSLADARKNAVYTGTVVKCYDSYVLVKFFNNLKGVLRKQELTGSIATEMNNFYVGQTTQFRVLGRKDEQISLGLVEDTFELGEICPVTVTHVLESGLEVKVEYDAAEQEEHAVEVTGLMPIRLLSDYSDLLQAKLRTFPLNTQVGAVSMTRNIFSLRDVDYFQHHVTNNWRSVQPGDILKAVVKNVSQDADVVELFVPIRGYGKLVKVHHKMLLVGAYRNPNIMLAEEQVVYVKVLSKEQATKTITVTAKLMDVWDGELSSTADYLAHYLKEVAAIKKALKKQGNAIAQYKIGNKITAQFQSVHPDTGDWQFEVADTKLLAVIRASFVGKAKPPPLGKAQECVILWIDYSQELLYVSNKPCDMEHINNSTEIPANVVGKSGINGKVLLKLENLFICSLKKSQQPLVYCPNRLHFNDFENSTSADIKEGEWCKLAFIHESKPIAVLESTWKLWQGIKRKRKAEEDAAAVKQKKVKLDEKKEQKQEATANGKETKTTKTQKRKQEETTEQPIKQEIKKAKQKKQEKTLEPAQEESKQLFYVDKTPDHAHMQTREHEQTQKTAALGSPIKKTAAKQVKEVKALPGISNFWGTDLTQLNQTNDKDAALSSDEEDAEAEAQANSQQKKKKLSAVDKFKLQREEEARIHAIEERNADPNQVPESVDQFDRLALAEPNNSKQWINYMVFYLQATEVDKARSVARRAIKSISFRCSDELLNIWVALLNLELRYGSKESFDETLKEALTYNEPIKVYLRALEILSEGGKPQQLIEMIGNITKKFKTQPEMWKAVAHAYFSIGMPDRAQQMLHKALASLPDREHVNTIVTFANLNQKYGNNELAQTLLEQVVTSYPKRVDVWTQYVDMLIKENLVDSARTVLERAVLQKIPLKKMRTIFKKYLEFEERFGTEAQVQQVKQLAMEYVKRNTSV